VAAAGAASLGPADNNDTDTGGRVRYVRFRRVTVVNFVEKLFDRSGPNLALCMRQDPQSTLVCRKISSGSVYSVVNFEKRSDRSGPNLTPRSRPTVHACARDFVGSVYSRVGGGLRGVMMLVVGRGSTSPLHYADDDSGRSLTTDDRARWLISRRVASQRDSQVPPSRSFKHLKR